MKNLIYIISFLVFCFYSCQKNSKSLLVPKTVVTKDSLYVINPNTTSYPYTDTFYGYYKDTTLYNNTMFISATGVPIISFYVVHLGSDLKVYISSDSVYINSLTQNLKIVWDIMNDTVGANVYGIRTFTQADSLHIVWNSYRGLCAGDTEYHHSYFIGAKK